MGGKVLDVPRYVPRAEWGAEPRVTPSSAGTISKPKGVVIHWEGPRMGAMTHDRCAGTVRSIQSFHVRPGSQGGRGWLDIAYNWVVCQHGYVYEGRGLRYRSAANGTTAANAGYYAVCALVGQGDPLTIELLRGLNRTVNALRASGAGKKVQPHHQHYATECPGPDLTRWIKGGMHIPKEGGAHVAQPARERYPGRLLKQGTRGGDVLIWQARLTELGYPPGPKDGIFGPRTEQATRQFQRSKGIAVDGIVGPITWGKAW